MDVAQHEEVDVLATLHEAKHDALATHATLLVTAVGLNATAWRPRPLVLAFDPPPLPGTVADVVTLTASGFDERSTFERGASSAVVGEEGTLSLMVPPFSIVRASVQVQSQG